MAEALHKILGKAKNACLLKGLGHFDGVGEVLNLYFANDTLLFLETDDKMAETLKLLLSGFENMSGLKINFHKSDMIPLNLSESESNIIASRFGCFVTHLPITYLGVPIH